MGVSVPTFLHKTHNEELLELVFPLFRWPKPEQIALALLYEGQLLYLGVMLDHDFARLVQLTVELGQYFVHNGDRRLVIVVKVLKEEREGFPLVDEHTFHELVLEVLRQILIKVVLLEEESRRTVDRVLDVRLAIANDLVGQALLLDRVAYVGQIVLRVGHSFGDELVDGEELLVGEDFARHEREKQDASVHHEVHVGHFHRPRAIIVHETLVVAITYR